MLFEGAAGTTLARVLPRGFQGPGWAGRPHQWTHCARAVREPRVGIIPPPSKALAMIILMYLDEDTEAQRVGDNARLSHG